MSKNIVHFRLKEKCSPVVRLWNLIDMCYRTVDEIYGNAKWLHLTVIRFFHAVTHQQAASHMLTKESLLQNCHCDKKCTILYISNFFFYHYMEHTLVYFLLFITNSLFQSLLGYPQVIQIHYTLLLMPLHFTIFITILIIFS